MAVDSRACAGVAHDVGITFADSECLAGVDTGIHTCQDKELQRSVQHHPLPATTTRTFLLGGSARLPLLNVATYDPFAPARS